MSDHKDWEMLDGRSIGIAWFRNRIPDMQPYVDTRGGARKLTLMATYLGDRTEAPDMDGPEELSQEQQQADFEDEMQQKMTRDQIDAIPRVEARQLLARVPAGPRYDDRVLLAVEQAMNLEWWRGYHAPKTIELADAGKLHDKLIRSYLLTINKGGPTESDLSAEEVDLILLALTRLAAPPRS